MFTCKTQSLTPCFKICNKMKAIKNFKILYLKLRIINKTITLYHPSHMPNRCNIIIHDVRER